MDYPKHRAESQTRTGGHVVGGSETGTYGDAARPGNSGSSPRTTPACRTVPVRDHKRFPSRLHRPANGASPHPAANHELRDSQRELRRLSAQLMTIQETERQRIAADLHDGIGQSLSLIKLSLESGLELMGAGESAQGLALFQGMTHQLNDAIAELRRTTSGLRPPMLDDLGIIPTLAWFFRQLEPVCGGKRIESEVAIAEADVPPPIKATIFRILQEAMNNVLKHADADKVRVCLKKSGPRIQLSIEDNGHGFDPVMHAPCDRRCGFGLLTMKERALSSGGVFEVESAPGRGTRIAVTWQPTGGAAQGGAEAPAKDEQVKTKGTRPSGAVFRARQRGRGFTLLELLVVMVIIGLLAGYVGPKYFSQIGKSQVKTARAQIDALGKALDQFRLDTGHYPTMEEGLQALVTRPSTEPKWDGPYLSKAVPPDPWGNPYVFKIPGDHGEYDLLSYGKDGRPGGDGEAADVTNW